jgi:hypothetical protein
MDDRLLSIKTYLPASTVNAGKRSLTPDILQIHI